MSNTQTGGTPEYSTPDAVTVDGTTDPRTGESLVLVWSTLGHQTTVVALTLRQAACLSVELWWAITERGLAGQPEDAVREELRP